MKSIFGKRFLRKISQAEDLKPFDFARIFRLLLWIIPIGMVGNIAFTFLTTDHHLLTSLSRFDFGYFALAMVLALVPWLTSSSRLLIWTQFLGRRLSFRDIFLITLGTELGSAVTPTAVGGGYVKLGLLVRKGFSAGSAASLMTLGSLEDALFFALALPVAATLSSSWNLPIVQSSVQRIISHIERISLLLCAILCIVGLLFWLLRKVGYRSRLRRSRRLATRINRGGTRIWRDLTAVYALISNRGKSRFALSMVLTAIQWASRYSVISALLACLGIACDPLRIFLLQWIVFTIMTFIPTPGASAGAEASFFLIYSSLLPGTAIGLITAAWRFLTFYFQLSVGSIAFLALYRPALTAFVGAKGDMSEEPLPILAGKECKL